MSVYKGQEKVLNSITAVEEEKVKKIVDNELFTNEKKYYGIAYDDLDLNDLTVSGFYFARYNLSTGVYSDLNYPCSGYGYVINRVYLNTETNHILQIFVPTGDKVQADLYMRKRAGSGGVWQPWVKYCATKVADVPWTNATTTSVLTNGTIVYRIKNGVCYVSINGVGSASMVTPSQIIATGLPKPEDGRTAWYSLGSNVPSDLAPSQILLVRVNFDGSLINHSGSNNREYYGSFSYPVAEL